MGSVGYKSHKDARWVFRMCVDQSGAAMFLIAALPAPQPIANADDLGCLPPGDLFGYSPQAHFVLYHPLPGLLISFSDRLIFAEAHR